MTEQSTLPSALVESLKPAMFSIGELLPDDISMPRFRAATMLHFQEMSGLSECHPDSIVSALVEAATYGMMPGRDCHIIPMRAKNSSKKRATFVPDYRGLIRSIERTGKVKKAFAHPVYSGDKFEVDYLADQFSHVPARLLGRQRGQLTGFYACIIMNDGTKNVDFMEVEDIDRIKGRSPAHDSGPWITDYNEMARKTVMKRLCKYVQLTPQMDKMLQADQVREEDDFDPQRGVQAAIDLFGEGPVVVDHTEPAEELGTPIDADSLKAELVGYIDKINQIMTRRQKKMRDGDELYPEHADVWKQAVKWERLLAEEDIPDSALADIIEAAKEGLVTIQG